MTNISVSTMLGAQRAAPAFTPLALSPLVWLRSDLVALDSGKVSQWTDKSGNGNHATQSNAAKRPTVKVAAFSPLETLTANLELLETAALDISAGCSVFAVVAAEANATWDAIELLKSSPATGFAKLIYNNSSIYVQDSATAKNIIIARPDGIFELDQDHHTDGASRARINGGAWGTQTGCDAPDPSLLRPAFPFQLHYEYAVFAPKLTDPQWAQLRAYATARYGV